MELYRHIVQYYETDRMGVTHHSNYIRWMEEARVDFFEQLGYGYGRLEEEGIVSPVTGLECHYKASTTFGDTVEIAVSVAGFKGAVLQLRYRMTKPDGQLAMEGRSEHCFLNRSGRIVRPDRETPELYRLLTSLAKAE